MAVNFLKNNQKSVLVCPDQVNEVLKRNADYAQVSGRINSLKSGYLFNTTLNINNMNIRIIRFDHGKYLSRILPPESQRIFIKTLKFLGI